MSKPFPETLDEILPCIHCGVNGDRADGFGMCTCGNAEKCQAITDAILEPETMQDVKLTDSDDVTIDANKNWLRASIRQEIKPTAITKTKEVNHGN